MKKLAKFLGALPQTLSDWLGGRFEPGGEVTLKLLQRVEQLELKQKKTPAVLEAQPGLKTRSAKSTEHEKAQSDRRIR